MRRRSTIEFSGDLLRVIGLDDALHVYRLDGVIGMSAGPGDILRLCVPGGTITIDHVPVKDSHRVIQAWESRIKTAGDLTATSAS